MNIIDKIVKELKESSEEILTAGHHKYNFIYEEKFKEIAQNIVKNLALSGVVKSLPTKKEMISTRELALKERTKDLKNICKPSYELGFIDGTRWIKLKAKVK